MYIKNNKYLFCNTETILGLLNGELAPDKVCDIKVFQLTCTNIDNDKVEFISTDGLCYMNNPIEIQGESFTRDFVHLENSIALNNVLINKMFDFLKHLYQNNSNIRAFRIGLYMKNYLKGNCEIPESLEIHMDFFTD